MRPSRRAPRSVLIKRRLFGAEPADYRVLTTSFLLGALLPLVLHGLSLFVATFLPLIVLGASLLLGQSGW